MNRIERAFNQKTGRAALIPFLNAGDPSMDASRELILSVLSADSDLVEIGLPYSDPLADGPVIQKSALRSLQNGFQLPQVFDLTESVRRNTDKGLILFTYYNPILQYGEERFLRDAALAGADGVIIPDLPMEESVQLRDRADAQNLALIPLVAPTSSVARIEDICSSARGFVYCVSSLGVTGERKAMHARLQDVVRIARDVSSVPVAVGFGVSTALQASSIAEYADGVIVGSAFTRRIEDGLRAGEHTETLCGRIHEFTRELKNALQSL